MDQIYKKKYLKYKKKYLDLKSKLRGSGPGGKEAEIREKRTECYKKCVMPKEYVTKTSGPEVEAKWDEWHQCYAKCLEENPYTAEELELRKDKEKEVSKSRSPSPKSKPIVKSIYREVKDVTP